MKPSAIRLIILLGILSLLGIIFVQTNILWQTAKIKDRERDEKIHIALLNVVKQIARENNVSIPTDRIIETPVNNYYLVNVDAQIDAERLEQHLSTEFEKHAILEDFEYSIYNCDTDEMVYGDFVSLQNKEPEEKKVTLDWPKTDFIYYFGVRFPSQETRLFSRAKNSSIFALVLLIPIFFLGYAIYIILRQKRLNQLQTDFVDNMSHEFKTPFNSIQLASQALLSDENIQQNPRLKRYSEIIESQVIRLNENLDQVLLRNSTHEKTDEEQFVVADVIQYCAKQYDKQHLHPKELTLEGIEESYQVTANKKEFIQVVNNLLNNAHKYGGDQMGVHLKRQNNRVQMCIWDNGEGIPDDYKQKVFEKFARVPEETARYKKGFGLGLYQVKQIALKNKWQVSVHNRQPNGTIIKIIF